MFQTLWSNRCASIRPNVSNPSATSSDGKAMITIRQVANMDHEKTGMRSSVMRGGRIRRIVQSTVPDCNIAPTAAQKVPRIQRFIPKPGEYLLSDSGGYANQPSEAAPSDVRNDDSTATAPNA